MPSRSPVNQGTAHDRSLASMLPFIFTAAAAGLVAGCVIAWFSARPLLDFLIGVDVIEKDLAWIMRRLHQAYLPVSRNALLVLLYSGLGTLGGAAAGLILHLIFPGPRRPLRRYLLLTTVVPGGCTLVVSALWIHRSLPVGPLEVLAAFGVLFLSVFLLARPLGFVLHQLFRRPWILLGLLLVLALTLGTRAALISPSVAKKPASISPTPAPNRVLLLGLDAASWANLQRQLDEGSLPHLASLREKGCWGDLESIPGYLSPSLWTTVATGVHPREHGIVRFTGGNIPFTSNARTAKALWEILPMFGQRSASLCWWATWPAEEVDGLMVSDRFLIRTLDQRVHPAGETTTLDSQIDISAEEMPASSWFLGPGGDRITSATRQEHEEKLGLLEDFVKQDHAVSSIGQDLLSKESGYDLVSVYLRSIDIVGHKFWQYDSWRHRPRLAKLYYDQPAPVQELMAPVIGQVQEWSDDIVGRLIAAAGPRTNIIICSDHGMTGYRPPASMEEVETGHHHHCGILVLAGPDIRSGRTLHGASLYDIYPTVLYLLGLPIPEGLEGRPLTEAIRHETLEQRPVRHIAGFGKRSVTDSAPIPSAADDELIKSLQALGYIE